MKPGGAPAKNQGDPKSSGRASSNGGSGAASSMWKVPEGSTTAYTISGSVPQPLRPGAPARVIPITFNSPNQGNGGSGLDGTRATRLTITIASVTGRGAGPNHCTAADFQLTQVHPLAYPFYIPFGMSRLASLIARQYLPTIRMVNRTDSVPGNDSGNQDACKNAAFKVTITAAS